jgi:hypothetical protein
MPPGGVGGRETEWYAKALILLFPFRCLVAKSILFSAPPSHPPKMSAAAAYSPARVVSGATSSSTSPSAAPVRALPTGQRSAGGVAGGRRHADR